MSLGLPRGHELARDLFVGAMTVALFLVVYAMASAPSRVASRLGLRGVKRLRAIESNPAWTSIEPLVRWLAVRFSGILSDEARARLDAQLALAGDWLGLTPDEYIALSVVSFFGGLAFGVVGGLMVGNVPMLVVICGPIGAGVPYLTVSGEAQRRMKQIGRGLPYVIDLMALAMSAGLDFPGAVKQVTDKSSDPEDALVEEMTRLLQELQLGKTRRQALQDFARRAPIDAVQEFVTALVQAEERGNPVAEVLSIQAGVSRMRRSVNAEEAAAKAGVAMVAPLFLLFACIMLLVVGPMVIKLAKGL
jgi:tight adherence protein C